jgi:hypothetical protein
MAVASPMAASAAATRADAGVAPVADAARGLECEAARVSAGMDPESAGSPLAVRAAKTIVRVAEARPVLEVRADRSADADEILKRAESLASKSR